VESARAKINWYGELVMSLQNSWRIQGRVVS